MGNHVKLCKIAIFKFRFQANYWTNQLETNEVTPTGLEVFEEASTTYGFLISEAPIRTNLKTDYRNIIRARGPWTDLRLP